MTGLVCVLTVNYMLGMLNWSHCLFQVLEKLSLTIQVL